MTRQEALQNIVRAFSMVESEFRTGVVVYEDHLEESLRALGVTDAELAEAGVITASDSQ
jgi:hypothetical protein